MTYEEFYYSIDCKFPYHQESEWKRIIGQSIEIAEDAPFLVLHEICRVPASEKLDKSKHMEMYKYWKQSFVSPVQDIVEPASLSYINKIEISDSEALDIMEKLSAFPKSYNALQVVLFSCPDDDELVDEKYENIVAQWKSAT
ncbi:hypothetical protein L2737_17510 [Shewanella electrodiphila]|uniref:DUF4265 domain-containing protein n=1 Tax=Shewanella electrodiphila TaxID=934143 RepID=A0ABT0KU03_9GAMM|nr:hypothetical protein [Shewanella electrodiphila]MCL1047099.1 hypothetical protein [Shewanella electrodiphila]